jgi:hypothetical protein
MKRKEEDPFETPATLISGGLAEFGILIGKRCALFLEKVH